MGSGIIFPPPAEEGLKYLSLVPIERKEVFFVFFSHRMFRIVNFPMDPPFPVIVRLPLRPSVESSTAGYLSEPPR